MTRDSERLPPELEKRGLLLLQDKTLPNVVSLVTGETVRGSWWAHPKSHEIFRILTELAHHPDVLFCKLLAGKLTLVHRRLWPALLAVSMSREAWQTRRLPPTARSLLRRVEKEGSVVVSGAPVKELERRMLVHAREEHTETGAHRIVVESWKSWARDARAATELSAAEGRNRLEEAASAIGADRSLLPWSGTLAGGT